MSGKMVYQFSASARLPKGLDAQAIGERLARLARIGGYTPADVVEDARNIGSPLHPAFGDLWDLTPDEALQRVLEGRASYLTRHMRIVVERKTDAGECLREPRPMTVSIVERTADARRYLPVVTAMSDADYREQVLEEAYRYFWAGRERYKHIAELSRLFKVIDEVVTQRRSKAQQPETSERPAVQV
jgi:hypothetical protein